VKWDSKELLWKALIDKLRAGSRTVLYRPKSDQLVVELARRGFRLLVAHECETFRTQCRRALQSLGLQSLLMGSHQIREGRPLKLARNFYDLIVVCGPLLEEEEDWQSYLGKGGLVVGPESLLDNPGLPPLEGLPEPFVGYRAG